MPQVRGGISLSRRFDVVPKRHAAATLRCTRVLFVAYHPKLVYHNVVMVNH
jgi:hypothetical protein